MLHSLLFLLSTSFAQTTCPPQSRQMKSCELKIDRWQLQITAKKILLNDGTYRNIASMPDLAELSEWDEVILFSRAHEYFIQFQMWYLNAKSAPVEELHWIVGHISNSKVVFGIDEVIQRRTKKAPGEYILDKKSTTAFEFSPEHSRCKVNSNPIPCSF